MMRYQRTLKTSVHCEGIGLHSGKRAFMRLLPAPLDTGIVFVRTDLGDRQVAAAAANTGLTSYATTLTQDGVVVRTVEHLLSAFAGLGIDNAFVEIRGDEVPIMDGSAGPFVSLIANAGIRTQGKIQPMLKILKPIFVREGDKQIAVWPAETSSISCLINFNHPMVKEQSLQYLPIEEFYLSEIAYARTFGFASDAGMLQAKGLALGASLENAVALGEDSVLNNEGLRYRDEFVRHKILDLIGDFALVGMPLIGHVVAHKTGHSLNARMVSKLLNSPQNWIIIGEDDQLKTKKPELQYQHLSV